MITSSPPYVKKNWHPTISIEPDHLSNEVRKAPFGGYTIQFEVISGLKSCFGQICNTASPTASRYVIYVDSNGTDIVYFSSGKSEGKDHGEKEKLSVPNAFSDVGARWKYERVFDVDKTSQVLEMKTKISDTTDPKFQEVVHMIFIAKSGNGCFSKYAIITSSTDIKTQTTYEPIEQRQSCRLIKGLHAVWGQ